MTGCKKVLNNTKRVIFFVLAIALACVMIVGCSPKTEKETEGKKLDFNSISAEKLEEYITLGEYKDISISLNGRTKENAVWDVVAQKANIKEYPMEHVNYYKDQLEGQYAYYAEQAGMSYEEMLEQLGQSDEKMLEDAKNMTKKDLVYAALLKKEGISLSEDEKQTYFDKYVKQYVESYGYSEEYVKENMAELI